MLMVQYHLASCRIMMMVIGLQARVITQDNYNGENFMIDRLAECSVFLASPYELLLVDLLR